MAMHMTGETGHATLGDGYFAKERIVRTSTVMFNEVEKKRGNLV